MPLTDLLPAIDYSQYTCHVYVNNQPLSDDFQLISMQVKQGYQYISSAHIVYKHSADLGTGGLPNPFGAGLPTAGSPIAVKAKLDFDEIVLFEGHIVRHKFKNSVHGTRFQVVAKTKAVNMALSTATEVYAKQSDKEVIDAIVSKNGGTLSTSHLTTQFMVKHTQLVKNGMNDWDFINVRAEANGCFVFTEKDTVTIDKPTQEFDPTKVITATYGSNVYEIEIEQDERKYQVEKELISFNLSSLETEVTEEESAMPSAAPATVKGKFADINYRTYNDMECSDLVNAATQLKTLSQHNGMVRIKANLTARPGGTIEIKGFNEVVDGKFIITSVLQDYSEGGFTSYIQFGLNCESYACKYDLQPAHSRPVVLTGIVEQLQDDPDNLNRIKVKIASWKDAQEPLWARLSTLYAGDQHGLVLLPEIGDEVVIAFIGNDFDVPVILGSAFSPKFVPHTEFKDDNYDKVLLTKKGMKWAWNDEKAIHEISTPGGNKIVISEDEKSITIQDQNSNKIVMNDSEINLTGTKDIVIKANANVKIDGAAVELNATGNIKLKGSMVFIN
ncbi:phage baseplate assembly protein V [Paraflavitalea pollutisoli]|uniref:phage baseplate assembly protein V n=1 Tax=Paraflavitalea pollutisoli TaxID=3034143 RepID=UPI0023EC88CC|nr:phage baseplate assembly protein V [Paraflavitalea sp. H1-2-19X]